jgi:hypothetical protein
MSDAPLRRPSDDPAELGGQLLRELDGIHRNGDSWEEPSLFHAYLQHAQALAWQGVAGGDLSAPRRILDHLLSAQIFIDRHRAQPPGLAAQAAEEVHQVMAALYLADDVLEEARTTARLADRDRSRTEREILRVLLENRGHYLRRGAVRKRMSAVRPTPARVGQILVDLHGEGLVLRTHARAQGSPSAAFYVLSPRGFEVCRGLGLEKEQSEDAWIHRAVAEVVSPQGPPEKRKILIDSLSTCSNPLVGKVVMEALKKNDLWEDAEPGARKSLLSVAVGRRRFEQAARVSGPAVAAGSGLGLYILNGPLREQGFVESMMNVCVSNLDDRQAQETLRDLLFRERAPQAAIHV